MSDAELEQRAAEAMQRRRRIGMTSAAVSAGLVAWLLARMDARAAWALLSQARLEWIAAAVAITLLFPLTSTLRWMGVLRAQPELRVPFRTALHAVMIANVLNSLLPSKAGDIMKAVYLREKAGLSAGVGTVVLERLVDLAVLGGIGVAGWALGGAVWGLAVGGILIGIISSIVLAILVLPIARLPIPEGAKTKALGFAAVFRAWVRRPAAIAQTVGASVVTWSLCGLLVCALVSALRVDLPWSYAFSVQPLALLAGLAPFTMSGVGTRDAAFAALLGARVSPEAATLIGLGYTVFAYWLLSLICLPAVYREIMRIGRATPEEKNAGES